MLHRNVRRDLFQVSAGAVTGRDYLSRADWISGLELGFGSFRTAFDSSDL